MKKSIYYLYLLYDLSILLGLFFGKYPFESFVIVFGLGLVFLLLPLRFYNYIKPGALLFLCLFMLGCVNGTLAYKYYLNEDYYKEREVFALTSGEDIPVKLENINDKFSLFIPEDFTQDGLKFASEKKNISIEVLFTDERLLSSEVESYVSSNAYYYEESGYEKVTYNEDAPNTISYIHDDIYYLEYNMSLDKKLVKIVFTCSEKQSDNYKMLFDLIILTIYFE